MSKIESRPVRSATTRAASRSGVWVRVWLCLCLGICLALPRGARAADGNPTNVHDAEKHFQHGVTLYVEADYRGALVEFNRAYALAPNGIVLFNIGETQYQLRDYADALASFERYLAETPQSDSHWALADTNVRELRTRVGRLRIITIPTNAEISVDDRVVGKTPLNKPVTVGVGRLTVSAAAPGRAPVTRTVDVAAEDEVSLTIELPASQATARSESQPGLTLPDHAEATSDNGRALRVAGWIATGVLAGGAVTFGLLARRESNDLRAARNVFPTTAAHIDHLANNTTTLSIVADSLAAATLVVGGITLYSTLGARKESMTSVAVGLGSIQLDLTF